MATYEIQTIKFAQKRPKTSKKKKKLPSRLGFKHILMNIEVIKKHEKSHFSACIFTIHRILRAPRPSPSAKPRKFSSGRVLRKSKKMTLEVAEMQVKRRFCVFFLCIAKKYFFPHFIENEETLLVLSGKFRSAAAPM